MKKFLIPVFCLAIVIIAIAVRQNSAPSAPVLQSKNTAPASNQTTYKEYPFDSGDDTDLSFTHRAYDRLQKEQALLDAGSKVIENISLTSDPELSIADLTKGVINRYTFGKDVYTLTKLPDSGINGIYQMNKNGQKLFAEQMNFGAEGPIEDARIVNDKPAFTFTSANCLTHENSVSCTSDVWYDGEFMSKKFNAIDARYLFSFDGKIGFVAEDGENDKIFYNGTFLTPTFQTIWAHNCCSLTEILPTVYQNGVLLFYAKQNNGNELVEIQLPTAGSN